MVLHGDGTDTVILMAISSTRCREGQSQQNHVLVYNDLPNDTQPLPALEDSLRISRKTSLRTSKSPAAEIDGPLINRSFSDNGLVNAKLSAKKRGRKPKNQPLLTESPSQLPEENPDMNDELAIGLPKEQYKPRPTHSRAPINAMAPSPALLYLVTNQQEVEKDEQSSPAKQPTSELNLSDEAFIGLPKESYKPRPSRSRSKKATGGDSGTTQPETVEAVGEVAISSAVVPDPADAPFVKQQKKSIRKTKVKRAKTSAAALLKKSQAMLSEGEDDVLWLETKPSEVKLELPPDIKREADFERKEIPATQSGKGGAEGAVQGGVTDERNLEAEKKDEDANAASQDVGASDAPVAVSDLNRESTTRTETTHIVIDIPPQPTSEAQVEPKRRGRKKKSSEVLENHDVDLEDPIPASKRGAEAGESEPSDQYDVAATKPAAKKRGRKKKAAEISDETEDLHDNY